MKLCQTAFALVICWCVYVQGQSQSCPAECSAWCGNEGLTFPGSNGRIVNVAFGKPASASSGYNDSNGPSAPACIAVNGRTSTIHRSTTQPNTNCIHTDRDDFNASWGVDLIRNYIVTNITIYRRQGQFGRRMAGLSVLVDGQLCYSFPNSSDTAALDKLPARIDLTCTPPLTGRVVKLQKHGLDTYGQFHLINICEVQVWACKDGLYGAQCDQTCSGHCKDNVPCDNYYGTCLTGCTAGTHGDDCGEQCGQCADSDTCNTVTGLCPRGCQPGWQGDNCKQGCADGIFGSGCSQRCGQCLNSSVCRHDNGFCEQGCSDGYQLSTQLNSNFIGFNFHRRICLALGRKVCFKRRQSKPGRPHCWCSVWWTLCHRSQHSYRWNISKTITTAVTIYTNGRRARSGYSKRRI